MMTTTHLILIKDSYDRVMGRNQKTGQMTKTMGWKTLCSCGVIVGTKSNNKKAHKAKVEKHKVGA